MLFFYFNIVSSVFKLNENNFKKEVISGNKTAPWFIMVGSSECPACVQAKPEFDKASNLANGIAYFGYIDAHESYNIASQLNVQMLPSFFLYYNHNFLKYDSSRSAISFISFIFENVENEIDDVDELWIDDIENKVILFTKKFKPPLFYYGASIAFKNKGIKFGMARDSDIIELFDNPPIPSIWFFKKGTKIQYKGKNDSSSVIQSISHFYNIEIAQTNLEFNEL